MFQTLGLGDISLRSEVLSNGRRKEGIIWFDGCSLPLVLRRKACIKMNPGDDIPMLKEGQSMALSSVQESQSLTPSHGKSEGIPSAARESLPVTASSGRESQEISSAVRESQSVIPSAATGYLENPSAVKEGQSMSTSPLRETLQNPSAVNVGQSTIPSPARATQGNSQAGMSISSGGGESSSACPSAFNQIVVYDPDSAKHIRGGNESDTHAASGSSAPPESFEQFSAFSVQCDLCFKRRLAPTKEEYEKIRANVLERPFVCSRAIEWNRTISCEDPTDIILDDSRIWAIDKPNIPLCPQGWDRLVRLRAEGGTKFADVYYVTPTGKKLRSTLDVQMYLIKNSIQDVHISQFNFKAPKPLREDYIRKWRPRPRVPPSVAPASDAPTAAQEEHVSSVTPLSQVPPSAVGQEGQVLSVTPISQAPPSAGAQVEGASSATPTWQAPPSAVAQVEGASSVTPISQAPPSAVAQAEGTSSVTPISQAPPSAVASRKRASSATPISRAPRGKRASSATPISRAPRVKRASPVTPISRAHSTVVPQVEWASTVAPISWAPPPAVAQEEPASSMTPTSSAGRPPVARRKRKLSGTSTSWAAPPAIALERCARRPVSRARRGQRAPSVTPISSAPPLAVAQEASSPARSSSATLSMPSSPGRSSSATLSMPSSPGRSSSATLSDPSSPARSSSATLSM